MAPMLPDFEEDEEFPGLPQEQEDAAELAPASEPESTPVDTAKAKRVIEAALICSDRPLKLAELCALFGQSVGIDTVRWLLDDIATDFSDRGIELVTLAEGWRFQSRPTMRPYLDRLAPQRTPKYSAATLQVLAVIAYRQPVTRSDIEATRGAAVSGAILKDLEDRGWIEVVGHRSGPGQPALFATTNRFLDDLNLLSLEDLPPIDFTPSSLVEPWHEEMRDEDGTLLPLPDGQPVPGFIPPPAPQPPQEFDWLPPPGAVIPPAPRYPWDEESDAPAPSQGGLHGQEPDLRD